MSSKHDITGINTKSVEYKLHIRTGKRQKASAVRLRRELLSNAQRSRGGKSKRGRIPSPVDICERPAIADQKTAIVHWESDTMIGGNHLGVLVAYIDKASKFLVAGLVKNKTASEINPCHRKTFPRDSP
jgi:IS30 family transposase